MFVSHRKVNALLDLSGLQQSDGSFTGDKWGEVDTRFSYTCMMALKLINALDSVDVDKGVEYVLNCQNKDGGFGRIVGAESHSGQGKPDFYSLI